MAEVVVEFVLKNLADFIVKETQFLGGVGEKVERVQRELTRIKCCLKDADSKRKGDERVQNWLNELRDVAYRIVDATDTYFLPAVEDHHQKESSSFSQKLKKVFKKPMKMSNLHKLGTELENIQNLLQEIYESRLRYGINDLPLDDKSKGEAVRMPLRRATYSEVDETQVVGMQADKNNIVELLRLEKTSKRAVITIIGAGGLGKTTLACMVYKSAKADFDYHIMLSISQQFSLSDLLRKMISKYNKDILREKQDVGDLVNELKSFLSSRRYLIILDDVWQEDLWNELKDILPNASKNGSRVLVTSRSIEVQKSAEYETLQYELKILDDRKSLDLLLKKALPYQEPDKKYPTDLLEVAGKLSKKCKGLPLALVVLGGILSKQPSYPTWERILQNMNWIADGKDCMRILAMSYEDLPYYLKACFQYLAFFPEDCVISAKCLIRMWVVEGFIPLNDKSTIEIMAEDCLEELAKRSMIQVLSRSMNGLIKHFQVHDILRDLAMNEARHENFLTVFSQASDEKKPNRIIRRASLQAQEKNSQFIEYVGPNIRSLLLVDVTSSNMCLHCYNFRLLKVLEIVGMGYDSEIKSLGELIHLKYLGLRNCKIEHSPFHSMLSLETLVLRYLWYNFWDDSGAIYGLWTVSTLKHVRVDHGPDIRGLPKGTLISNLQTLKWLRLEGGEIPICDLKFPNLRKFGFKYHGLDQWVSITNLLQTWPLLVSLWIEGHRLPMEIVYPKSLPNYQNLQSLNLRGKWPENVNIEANLLPPHLVKLSLWETHLKHNPMPELGKLNSLKKLRLKSAFAYRWEGSIICSEGFPALQYLIVDDVKIKNLTVAQGVMPKLTYLQVTKYTNVLLPPELQHVTMEIFVEYM